MAKPWYLETSTRSEPSEHLTTERTSGRKKRAAKDVVAETTSTPKTITTLLGDFDYERKRNRQPRGRSHKNELFVEKFILVETPGPNTEKERPSTFGPGDVVTGTGTGENTMITSAPRMMTTSPGNYDYQRKRNRQERPTTTRPGQLVTQGGSQAPPTGSRETPTGSQEKVTVQKVTNEPEGDGSSTGSKEIPTESKESPTGSKDSPTGSKDKVIVQKVAKKPEGEEQESADGEELDAVVVNVTEEKNSTSSSSTTEAPPMIEDVQRILLPPDDEKTGMETNHQKYLTKIRCCIKSRRSNRKS